MQRRVLSFLLAVCPGGISASPSLAFFPGLRLPQTAYESLTSVVTRSLVNISASGELCLSHSVDGAKAAFRAAADGDRCKAGLAVLGAAPTPDDLDVAKVPVLVILGQSDGVTTMSHYAVAMHIARGKRDHRFALIRGASHLSFVGSPQDVGADLQADLPDEKVHASVAELLVGFLRGDATAVGALSAAETDAEKMAEPLVDALKLEGSSAFGQPACNSDFPTNPTCKYPKWPDHSLPFGPAPAPSPPLQADCICGSPWVADTASKMMYRLPSPAQSFALDAFHDVSDVHPFHLPHIFNGCDTPDASCDLNTTTLTMPYMKPGALWADLPASAQPVSALEMRAKLKSVEAIWDAAKVPGASSKLDDNYTACAAINQAALDWALANAEKTVVDKYLKQGEPLVIVDDKKATIGATGPEWIKDELVFTRVTDAKSPSGSHVEVQSWMFVVGNTNQGKVPWFFPAGMHYCKLLSPARAMEWIYTDSHRAAVSKARGFATPSLVV